MTNSEARPLALITSASTGIGLDLAEQSAENGFDLLITAASNRPRRLWVSGTVSRPLISAFAANRPRSAARKVAQHDRPPWLSTRIPDARPRAELAGATGPIRRSTRRHPLMIRRQGGIDAAGGMAGGR
jgi:NAD(P)-dependent dehydrogenase (short-subunit alcohol dehydrogenase family)